MRRVVVQQSGYLVIYCGLHSRLLYPILSTLACYSYPSSEGASSVLGKTTLSNTNNYNNSGSSNSNNNKYNTGGGHYRPFSSEDELHLASVLSSKPRHVARHIRQSMLHSRRRTAQFRNSVTYLMILLQSRLQRREINPEDATIIVENIMRECVELRQGDMAHLLFRAAIRFRKYGLQVGLPLVKYLFNSYKHENAQELMLNMAEELRHEEPLKLLAVLAYQFSGKSNDAVNLLKDIPRTSLTTKDYCALAEGFGSCGRVEEVYDIAIEVMGLKLTHVVNKQPTIRRISSTMKPYKSITSASHEGSSKSASSREESLNKTTIITDVNSAENDCNTTNNNINNNNYNIDNNNNSIIDNNSNEKNDEVKSTEEEIADHHIDANPDKSIVAGKENDLEQQKYSEGTTITTAAKEGKAVNKEEPEDEAEKMWREIDHLRSIDMDAVVSSCVVATREHVNKMNEIVQIALRESIRLSDAAMGAILRSRLEKRNGSEVKSVADVYAIESTLRTELGVKSLGMIAETYVIARCSELMYRGHEKGDEVMLNKVEHLREVMESAIANDTVEDFDFNYSIAVIRGFGVLGKFNEMRECFNKLDEAGAMKDHRLYDEMLRWYANAYNLKEVIALKEEMTRRNIYHTLYTYYNVFRVLDRYYPRMVEKYVSEMRARGMQLEGFMYPTLMRVYSELQNMNVVEELYNEAKSRTGHANRQTFTPVVLTQMLRICRHDKNRCEAIIRDAELYGLLSHELVQAEIIEYYSINDMQTELQSFLTRLPYTSHNVYRVLLRDAAKRKDRRTFDLIIQKLNKSGAEINDRLFCVIIAALSHFNDPAATEHFIHRAMASGQVLSPLFFAEAAAAYARFGNTSAVDQCWRDLLNSKLVITMPVYNRFLEIYMGSNNLTMVQEILDTMMKLVPPNPITATTVVDMLGKMGRFEEMEAVLNEMSRSTNAAPTLVTFHQAMNAYAKCGDVVQMENIRARLQQEGFHENQVTYNILFDGYGRAKRYDKIHDLVAERKRKNIPMEEFAYVVLLNIYARAHMPAEAEALVEEMLSSGIQFSGRVLATVASSFSVLGNIPQTEHFVKLLLAHPECRQRDVESIFMIYARLRDTVKLQELLDTEKLVKNETIYNVCVSAFARAGEYSKVAHLLTEMESRGFTLHRNTSVTLSSLLLKAGKLELAQVVLKWNGSNTESDNMNASTSMMASLMSKEKVVDKSSSTSSPQTSAKHENEGDGVEDDVLHTNIDNEDVLDEQLKHEVSKIARNVKM